MKAIWIATTGEFGETDDISLSALQEKVDGLVQAVDLSPNLTLWCNEEGKLRRLAHNPYAQYLWDKAFGAETDYLVGDIILTGGVDDNGNTLPLSAISRTHVMSAISSVRRYTEPGFQVMVEKL